MAYQMARIPVILT